MSAYDEIQHQMRPEDIKGRADEEAKRNFNAVAGTITVPAITPAIPLVLCNAGFLHTLATVELEVARLNLATPQDAQGAANLLQRLTTAGSVLEKARQDLKAPFIAKGKEIDAAASGPATRIESAKRLLKTKQTAYADEQARIAREQELARQKELRALQEQKAQEDAERDRKARELAAQIKAAEDARIAAGKAPMIEVDFGDEPSPVQKTETELKIEAVMHAPAVVAEKAAGIAWRTTLLIDSIDVGKLPEMFVVRTANEKALRATFTTGYKEGDPVPECAGVVFRIFREPVSTGRSQF